MVRGIIVVVFRGFEDSVLARMVSDRRSSGSWGRSTAKTGRRARTRPLTPAVSRAGLIQPQETRVPSRPNCSHRVLQMERTAAAPSRSRHVANNGEHIVDDLAADPVFKPSKEWPRQSSRRDLAGSSSRAEKFLELFKSAPPSKVYEAVETRFIILVYENQLPDRFDVVETLDAGVEIDPVPSDGEQRANTARG